MWSETQWVRNLRLFSQHLLLTHYLTDFSTMEQKLNSDQYHDLEAFIADGHLVFENCRAYNPEGSVYAKNATKMEKFMKDQLASYLVKQED